MAKTYAYSKAETEAKLRSLNLDTNFHGVEVYGVEWNITHAATEVTRVGDLSCHASLPVQSQMRRCLLDDDGNVNYYLHANDSTLRQDGTPAVLDGTHGQVMVEIPRHWARFDTAGNIRRALISMNPFPGSHEVRKSYISAYKAALHRPDNKLSSVVNDSAEYRGGANDSQWDQDVAGKSHLVKPATSTSLINFRSYAQNRGSLWFDMDYSLRKTIFWLITIEYATRNHQIAVDQTLTPEGYRKGCLGTGPTGINGTQWSEYNTSRPLFRCGSTNSLGNFSGEVQVTLEDFPTPGLSLDVPCNSYRGVENFFGDIWEWTNGVNIKIENGVANAYVANGLKTSSVDYMGYSDIGQLPPANGYITDILFGSEGDILPKSATGGSSTTYYADYWYLGADGLRGLLFGGVASTSANAGAAYAYSSYAPSTTGASIGSRLCFFPR